MWSRPFASAPVLAYHVDRVTGALQQLDFQPLLGGGPGSEVGDGPLAVMELVPTQSPAEAADLIEQAREI